MTFLQQKRAKSTKLIEERRIEEHLKIEQELLEKEKYLKIRESNSEKHRQNIRESFMRKSEIIFHRNYLKKIEQEQNLKGINKQLEKYRLSKIEKFRDEPILKSRIEIDFSKIKAEVESELRKAHL